MQHWVYHLHSSRSKARGRKVSFLTLAANNSRRKLLSSCRITSTNRCGSFAQNEVERDDEQSNCNNSLSALGSGGFSFGRLRFPWASLGSRTNEKSPHGHSQYRHRFCAAVGCSRERHLPR